MLLLLTSCVSVQPVRPIVKIGLIAPFEGLYRNSGYAALEGMRQAVTACAPVGMDVLPLALDDSGDPSQAHRAAQKLRVDPAVRAIVGPLLLDTIPTVSDVISSTPTSFTPIIAWYIPPLVTPNGGFAAPSTSDWLIAQVEQLAASTTAKRVLLAGLPATWELSLETSLPTLRVDDLPTALTTIRETDAMLWLGRPEAGIEWQAAIYETYPTVEFWLAPQAGLDVFIQQTEVPHSAHWLIWTSSEYNQRLQSDDTVGENVTEAEATEVMRELTYQATCEALRNLGADLPKEQPTNTR